MTESLQNPRAKRDKSVYRFGLWGFIWVVAFYAVIFSAMRIALDADRMVAAISVSCLLGTAIGFPAGFAIGGFVDSVIGALIGLLLGFWMFFLVSPL